MAYANLPQSALYDPRVKIRPFQYEDWAHIRFRIKAVGGIYTDTEFTYELNDENGEKVWKRPKEIVRYPQFIAGRPSRFDAIQGAQGDCWFVAAVMAASRVPEVMDQIVPEDQNFTDKYIGAFHFRFWRLGAWYDVVVDDRLAVWKDDPTQLCFTHSRSGNVFWAALLEKAFAKFCSTQSQIPADILDAGWAKLSLLNLTGGIVEMLEITKFPLNESLKWQFTVAYDNSALMCFHCYQSNRMGIIPNHTYVLTKIFIGPEPTYHGLYILRLLNPIGQIEWKGKWSDDDFHMWKQIDQNIRRDLDVVQRDDGEFWIDDENLARYFDAVTICYLNPGHYIAGRPHAKTLGHWKNATLFGEWVRGVSAVGSDRSNRHKNPQFKIELDFLPNLDGGNHTVIMDLVQRSKVGRKIRPNIAFYIYPLAFEDIPVPLDRDYLATHSPVDSNPNFASSYGRSYQHTMRLKPGQYIIIPCTEKPNEESQFLLRVFAESFQDYWVYDSQVSKLHEVTDETNLYMVDEGLYRAFNAVKEEDDEIDWISLKEILDEMFSQTSTGNGLFGYVMSLVRYIRGIFTQANNENDQAFSKDYCRRMITMLDSDRSGKLNFTELRRLWSKIDFWAKVYDKQKDEKEEHMTVSQLRDALSAIGFKVNKRIVHSMSYLYADDQGHIDLTDFIICGITLETTLDSSKKFGKEKETNFTLEEWVKFTLNL